jgi:adenylate cyclase
LPYKIEFPYQWDRAYRSIQERLVDGFRAATLTPEITVATLISELKNHNPSAVVQLGWFGPAAKEAVPHLIVALEDTPLRREVVRTLGKIGPDASGAIPALTKIKDDALVGTDVKDAIKQIMGYKNAAR